MPDTNSPEFYDTMRLLAGFTGGAGAVGGIGKMVYDANVTNAKTQKRYDMRVKDKFDKMTVGQLNDRQLKALKYLGVQVSPDVNVKVKDLQITPKGAFEAMPFGEYMFKHNEGINGAKIGKNDKVGLTRRTALNEFITPIQQQVLQAHGQQLTNKQVTNRAVSQQLHEGGSIPKINKKPTPTQAYVPTEAYADNPAYSWKEGTHQFAGAGTEADPRVRVIDPVTGLPQLQPGKNRQMFFTDPKTNLALEQGAAGVTAPSSALITNPSFYDPNSTFTMREIQQRLPEIHPSFRRPSPLTPEAGMPTPEQPSHQVVFEGDPAPPAAMPQAQPEPPIVDRTRQTVMPPSRDTGWTGAETEKARRAEYSRISAERRGVGKGLRGPFIPGATLKEQGKNLGRNIVRGVVNAPTSAKVTTGLGFAAIPALTAWQNYSSDATANDIAASQPRNPTTPQTGDTSDALVPSKNEQTILDAIRASHPSWDDNTITKWAQNKSRGGDMQASARIWLKFNAKK